MTHHRLPSPTTRLTPLYLLPATRDATSGMNALSFSSEAGKEFVCQFLRNLWPHATRLSARGSNEGARLYRCPGLRKLQSNSRGPTVVLELNRSPSNCAVWTQNLGTQATCKHEPRYTHRTRRFSPLKACPKGGSLVIRRALLNQCLRPSVSLLFGKCLSFLCWDWRGSQASMVTLTELRIGSLTGVDLATANLLTTRPRDLHVTLYH